MYGESDDAAKSCAASYRTIYECGRTPCGPSFFRVNPDTIGCVWAGEFDFKTLRIDGEIFEVARIQKYPDTCGRGLKLPDS